MTTLIRHHTSSRRGRRSAGLIAALTMTVAALAACSSAGTSDGDAVSESSAAAGSDGSSSGGETAPSEVGAADSGSTSSSDYGSNDTSAARAPAMERSIISNGTVSLVSDDVAKARQDVQRIVDANQGTVSEENTDTDDEGVATYSRMVIRVPSSSFRDTIQALEKAADLRQSQKSSEDVTTQVIDTDVRVRAQQSSLRRVEQLLARADSLKDIIWIESQLTSRQAELDSLKSQQAWLTDQTRESTITIDIQRTPEHEVVEEESDEPSGFVGGLEDGMKALGAFTTALATIAGTLLPFAIVLLVLGGPAWLLVRRSARRRTPKQPITT